MTPKLVKPDFAVPNCSLNTLKSGPAPKRGPDPPTSMASNVLGSFSTALNGFKLSLLRREKMKELGALLKINKPRIVTKQEFYKPLH